MFGADSKIRRLITRVTVTRMMIDEKTKGNKSKCFAWEGKEQYFANVIQVIYVIE